jgi:hypothetical protein
MSTEKRTRMSANYILEVEDSFEERDGTQSKFWKQVKDGFVSPEKALAYAETEKICGLMRVIRVAVAYAFGGTEQVYALKQKSTAKVQGPRQRKVKTDQTEKTEKKEEGPTDEEIRSARNLYSTNPILNFNVGAGQKEEAIQVGRARVVTPEYDEGKDPDEII